MDETIKLIKKALNSDSDYTCSMTQPLDILWDAYNSDCAIFDKMVEALKVIEMTG